MGGSSIMRANIRTLALGALAALGLSAGAAKAADLEEIAAFALDICDAVNATGITISSADHCMKFSGEFIYQKGFYWQFGTFSTRGYTALELLIEVMGDSDFGVTRGWLDLDFCLDTNLCGEEYGLQGGGIGIDEIGISIGNTTVLATGSGATIANWDDDETLTHLLNEDLFDGEGWATGGVYVSVTHDLGNGWSIAKAVECIDSCSIDAVALVGVVSYDNGDGITGHLSVLSYGPPFNVVVVHGGVTAELDRFALQGAFVWFENGDWETDASIKAIFDTVELAGGFTLDNDGDWFATFSVQVEAGNFTIAKAIEIDDIGFWEFESEIATDLSDTLNLSATFHYASIGIWSVEKELTWTPGGGYEASASLRYESLGNWLLEGTSSLEF